MSFADWLVEQSPNGAIRVADPAAEHDPAQPRPRTLMVTLRVTSGWPAQEVWGTVVLVRDTTRVHVTSSPDPKSDLNRSFLPRDHPRYVIGSAIAQESARPYLVAVARAVAPTRPDIARLVLAPDHTRRRIHWPGLRHVFIKAASLTMAIGSLAALAAFPLLLGPLAVRKARALRNACPRCAYDLTGLEGRPCPECGSAEGAHHFPPAASIIPALAATYERE